MLHPWADLLLGQESCQIPRGGGAVKGLGIHRAISRSAASSLNEGRGCR